MELEAEIINNVYKNAHIALQSISDIIDQTECEKMRTELKNEYDGYEKIIGEISEYMASSNIEPQDVNFMKKAMLFTAIKMNTITDESCSHIAELMIRGTVNGICELRQIITRGKDKAKPETISHAEKLLQLEETYEENLKKFL